LNGRVGYLGFEQDGTGGVVPDQEQEGVVVHQPQIWGGVGMSVEANKAVVGRLDAILNNQDLGQLEELCSQDMVNHS
jgi:hypothetical protein